MAGKEARYFVKLDFNPNTVIVVWRMIPTGDSVLCESYIVKDPERGWQPDDRIFDYLFFGDVRIDEVTEEAAKQAAPEAFTE